MSWRASWVVATLGVLSVLVTATIAEARGRACREVSDVVGEERCTRYGRSWAVEETWPIDVEAGFALISVDPRYGGLRAQPKSDGSTNDKQLSFTIPGSYATTPTHGWGGNIRLAFAPAPFFYVGVDWLLGGGHTDLRPGPVESGYLLQPTHGVNSFLFGNGLYAGLRLPLGILSLRAEARLAARLLTVSEEFVASGTVTTASASHLEGFVETRALADVWFVPHATVSVFAGLDPIRRDFTSAGVLIGFHGRAFSGAYSL